MTDELGREELLAHLDWWRKVAHIGSTCERGNTCNQAYKQIKALIQKPEMDEKFIEEKAREMFNAVDANYVIYPKEAKNFIRSLIEEISSQEGDKNEQ